MSNFNILSAITRGAWLISNEYADGFLPLVNKLLSGEAVAIDISQKAEQINCSYAFINEKGTFKKVDALEDLSDDSVFVTGISGPVMKDDFCGAPGTATIRQHLKWAAENPKISAIVIPLETGGGSVAGTMELADDVREISKIKPVIGYVDSMSCSAGYAIHSGCSKIFASHLTAEVGSIGVATTIRDYSEKLKKEGIVEHYFNAPGSPDKNDAFMKAREGNYEQYQKERLEPLREIFVEIVKKGRGEKLRTDLEDVFTGKTYYSADAFTFGLIDGICSFEDAVQEAYYMGLKNKSKFI
jgi:ClpP class serine protease